MTEENARASSSSTGAWKVAATGVAGALAGSLIGVWGSFHVTDQQLDAEREVARLEKRAEVYEEFLTAVEAVKTELGVATNFRGTSAELGPADLQTAAKRLVDLQYRLNSPQSQVAIYGVPEVVEAAARLEGEVNEAIVQAILLKVESNAETAANTTALQDQLAEAEKAQAAFTETVRDDIGP